LTSRDFGGRRAFVFATASKVSINPGQAHGSGFPFLNLLDIFRVRNVLDGGDERNLGGGALDFPAEGQGQEEEPVGGQGGEVSLLEFGLDAGQFFGEAGGAGLGWSEEPLAEFVQLNGRLVLDFEAELAVPLDEGATGNAEFGREADQAPTLGAALDEFLTGFR
jgi:hypothetical protein